MLFLPPSFSNIDEITGNDRFTAEETKSHTLYFKTMGWKNKKMIPSYQYHEMFLEEGMQTIKNYFKIPAPAEQLEVAVVQEGVMEDSEEGGQLEVYSAEIQEDSEEVEQLEVRNAENQEGVMEESEDDEIVIWLQNNKRSIDQVDSSSDSSDDDLVNTDEKALEEEVEVEVTPPGSHDTSLDQIYSENHSAFDPHGNDSDDDDDLQELLKMLETLLKDS